LMDNRVPYPFSRFDWVPSLRQTIDVFRQSDRGRGVPIDFTSSLAACVIEGHEEALARAVLNVLENAVQYSPPDRVELRVLMHREGDHVLLDIVDQGDGISPSEQALVFDRFYRGASAQERSIPGAGLGLTLARYIIHAHQGTLTLQSTLRKGSTFTIRLPLFPIQ
jgi:two-component system sensor histidine kinase MprB